MLGSAGNVMRPTPCAIEIAPIVASALSPTQMPASLSTTGVQVLSRTRAKMPGDESAFGADPALQMRMRQFTIQLLKTG